MSPDTNDTFRTWLKSKNMIKHSYDAAVVCITYEGIINFVFFPGFDN